jgi:hypothetical protein
MHPGILDELDLPDSSSHAIHCDQTPLSSGDDGVRGVRRVGWGWGMIECVEIESKFMVMVTPSANRSLWIPTTTTTTTTTTPPD